MGGEKSSIDNLRIEERKYEGAKSKKKNKASNLTQLRHKKGKNAEEGKATYS